ncbi:Charged multivesicular body protein 2b [Halotydeus destructor]|nr:Charged multivesicular body protein 2b [Halotydeus destructor]
MFKKANPAEQMRKQQQELRQAQRDIDRSKRDLERQEKTLEMEIKKAAKLGNKQVCAVYAKQLVQLRKQKARLSGAGSQIGAVGAQAKVMQANSKLANAMATTAKTMGQVNDQMKTEDVMKMMQDFDRENQKMNLKEELIDDALSSALDHSDDEEEQDAIIAQVLDEIGIDINAKLSRAPLAKDTVGAESSRTKNKMTDSELEAQLAQLKM